MADDQQVYEVELAGEAMDAISQIASILRRLRREDVTLEEALQRAVGTALYLLTAVERGAIVTIESNDGRVQLDLTA
jgi:hypothetical protein